MRRQGKPTKTNRCGLRGKRRFRDHRSAIEALRRIRSNSVRQTVPARAYECDACGGWHLTSAA